MGGLPGRDAGADGEETSGHRCVGLALRGEVCARDEMCSLLGKLIIAMVMGRGWVAAWGNHLELRCPIQ